MKTNRLVLFSALAAFCAALPLRADTTDSEFPHVVQVEQGTSEFAPGDNIVIEEVRGDTNTLGPGGTFCVKVKYTLASHDEADLSLFMTTTNRTPTPIDPKQTARIKKGSGTFNLIKHITEQGYLHVTFYSRDTGQGFGGVYFGQGQWVLRHPFGHGEAKGRSGKSDTGETVSTSGPNRILFNYLGNPVLPPPNMDAAYTADGLSQAMRTAAQNAGISLVKLEIDDSEFPFLVGVVFAGEKDKAKFISQIHTMPAYQTSGGVGGETSYAMNIVPYRAFPPEAGQQIYRRMMLREAVLHDRISGVR